MGAILQALGALAAQVARSIGISLLTQTIVNAINGAVTAPTPTQPLGVILQQVDTIESQVTSPLFGLAHIEATIVTNQAALLAAIGSPQQSGAPVTLPPSPPPVYVAPTSSANAVDVWNFPVTAGGFNLIAAFEALQHIANAAANMADFGSPIARSNPFVYLVGGGQQSYFNSSVLPVPVMAMQNCRASDTVLSFFQREDPIRTWVQDTSFGGRVHASVLSGFFTWVATVYDGELQAWRAATALPSSVPVWPGIAGVTLGTPVAITSSMNIPGPMQGVIIDITATDPNRTLFNVGGMLANRNIGTCTFVDDHGEAEPVHFLNFQKAVELPHTMASASSFRLQNAAGLVGTITPFTIP